MRPIDPVVLREELNRIAQLERASLKAAEAVKVLQWFHTYGTTPPVTDHGPRELNDAALRSPVIGAQGTSGSELAQKYVNQAFEEFAPKVVERAIEIAQAELETWRRRDK